MTEPTLPLGPNLGTRTDGSALRLLFVEASGYHAGLLEETSAPGQFAVVVARDAREALEHLRESAYDAIVIELPAPEETATELLDGIAEIGFGLSQRVAFLVSDLSRPGTRKVITQARRPFLTEPVDAGQLGDLVLRIGLEGSQPD